MRTVLMGLVLGLLVGCGGKGKDDAPEERAKEKPTVPQYSRHTKVALATFVDEWQKNQVAASDKYKLRGIEFTARLDKIGSWFGDDVQLYVSDGNGNEVSVLVKSGSAARTGLKKCVTGGQVIIAARTDGDSHTSPWLVADEIRSAD